MTTRTPKTIKTATWIDDQYVVTDTGTANEWYSCDGDNWVDQCGHEVIEPEFAACQIVLRFGPRDGQTVG